jgi:CheY-like chemotaxis protein
MKILVVDDEPGMMRLFEQRFRKEIRDGDLRFVFAQSGEEALEKYHQQGSDLVMILSDINMPGMNGLELLQKLKDQGAALPVFMISAYENEQYQQKTTELGASGFIPKPLDFDRIKTLIYLQTTKKGG